MQLHALQFQSRLVQLRMPQCHRTFGGLLTGSLFYSFQFLVLGPLQRASALLFVRVNELVTELANTHYILSTITVWCKCSYTIPTVFLFLILVKVA